MLQSLLFTKIINIKVMSVAENLSRLNVNCHDLIKMFESSNISESNVLTMKKLIDSKEHTEMLDICLGFRRSMPYLDHETITEKLYICMRHLEECFNIEKKNLIKKIKALQLDPKADQELLNKLKDSKNIIEEKKAKAMIGALKLKMEMSISLDAFIKDKNFDALAHFYKSIAKEDNVITEMADGSLAVASNN
jgi:hypothetical protein